MPIQTGLLIQPYASMIWGDLNLSAYADAGTGELERLAQKITLSYSKTEDAPTCEFEITPTADGFDVVSQIRQSKELLTEVVEVAMGYEHLPEVSLRSLFIFAALDFTTGQDPKVKFTLVSAVKSSWTENRINYSTEDEMPLSEYPAFLQEKAGKGAALLKFKFVGQAEIDAADIMLKPHNRINQTPQVILAEITKEHGMELRHGDTALDGTIVIGYPASMPGELAVDKPELDGQPQPGVRRVHILGPGLIENASRKQSFIVGQSDTRGGTKSKATAASETENKKVTENAALPQQIAGQLPEGAVISGPTDKPMARSATAKDSKNKEEARSAMAKNLAMKLDAQFPMVPQVCGMKPGDLLAIPSIKGPADYIEDYEITEVKYSQNDTGAVMMSIQCISPYVSSQNLMDAETVEKVKARCKQLTHADMWVQYYWRQGPDVAWPLAGT